LTATTQNGDPQAAATLIVGLIGFGLVLVTIIGVVALYRGADNAEFAAKNYGAPHRELAELRNKQLQELGGYRWLDQTKGAVGLPIERAMELTVRDLADGQKKSN
jgi:hypothetical protein